MVCSCCVGVRGTCLGAQCCNMSSSAIRALLVWLLIVLLLVNDLSYKARSAALPTRPKSCVVVKEHLPASLRACSGVIVDVVM